MRDIVSNIKPVQHVAAQAITATNTPSTGVDLAGFGGAMILISIGTVANIANSPQPSWTFKLEESDSASTGFTAVTDANVLLTGSSASPVTAPDSSTGVFLTIDNASEDAAVYAVGYIGGKRYIRVVATAANTPGSTPYAVSVILGLPDLAPVSH